MEERKASVNLFMPRCVSPLSTLCQNVLENSIFDFCLTVMLYFLLLLSGLLVQSIF